MGNCWKHVYLHPGSVMGLLMDRVENIAQTEAAVFYTIRQFLSSTKMEEKKRVRRSVKAGLYKTVIRPIVTYGAQS